MRLLQIGCHGDLSLAEYFDDKIPPYAILSHTWDENNDEEVTFRDIEEKSGIKKAGNEKIEFCRKQATKDGLKYFWVDTCCINKANQNELSEAINLMFRWYRDAAKCYVFLSDVSSRKRDQSRQTKGTWELGFRTSRWFRRGWTLQELIAPASVQFFSRDGEYLGDKSSLVGLVHEITEIPVAALKGTALENFSVDERMRWAAKRQTKKKEDKAYCLLGIFNVSMPFNYGEEEHAFTRLEEEIEKRFGENRYSISIKKIDASLRTNYLRGDCLTIERLSGRHLPMDHCFINLAIVDHLRDGDRKKIEDDSNSDSDITRHPSRFSLAARLKVETSLPVNQVTLPTLFKARERPDRTITRPNRILIWGRAGVGKSTICKKIVYDFIHNNLWSDLFSRVYWLPLRRLKLMRILPETVEQLIQSEYLSELGDGQHLRDVLRKALASDGKRTLFVLDGLDEVSSGWDADTPMGRMLSKLLNQENIIITSRPHSTYVLDRRSPDLELEVVGFFPAQVEEYLECEKNQAGTPERTSEIRSFIQSHPLIRSLARIPIQLDAICYAWSATRFPRTDVTMTLLYQHITQLLWEKDIIRLEKREDGQLITRQRIQGTYDIERFVEHEVRFLQRLAFACLCNEIVEFDLEHVRQVDVGQGSVWGDRPVHFSFLRSSDSSLEPINRTYHFIHLTFQEFFAAQHFVQQWTSGADIHLPKMDMQGYQNSRHTEQLKPEEFLGREKYSARYNIFWRFVVGILHSEKDLQHLHRFFDIIEDESRDLLGSMHQRLVIGLLSEVSKVQKDFESRRRELEDLYWEWIMFEWKINSSTALMKEAECPERLLLRWMKGSRDELNRVIKALTDRQIVSSEVLKQVMSRLDKADAGDTQNAAFRVLGKHCSHISGREFFDWFQLHFKTSQLKFVRDLAGRSDLGRSAVEALLLLLQDESADVRARAADALGGQATLPASAVAALVALLQDESAHVRWRAADALGGQATLPASAVAALVALLQDESADVRKSAADALRGQATLPASAVAALVALLQDESADVRWSAANALRGQATLPASAVAALVALLQDESAHVRWSAANALGGQATLPASAVAALVALLQDESADVRSRAADALGGQATLPASAVAALVALLQDESADVRWRAADALGGQATLPASAVAALVALLQDESADVRASAADALGGQATLPASAVAALVALLQDESAHVRWRAADALGGQATLPASAVAALVALLQDESADVRWRAADALGGQATLPASAVAALVALLQDESADVRARAADALGGQATLPASAVAALVALLQDESADVRWRAADALGGQATLPASAVAALVALLQDESADVRARAADALGGQATLPASAVAALVALLQDESADVRKSAADALRGQATLPASAVEAIVPLLGCEMSNSDAARSLANCEHFYSLVPTLTSSTLRSLLTFWLRRSFYDSRTCFIRNRALFLDIDGKLREIPLKNDRQQAFEHAYREARVAIGIPQPTGGPNGANST